MISSKQSVEKMQAYVNASHSVALNQNARFIKLDSNEATVSPAPSVVAALMNFIQTGPLNWYPDVESSKLIAKLASYTGLPQNFIQTFNGSDNALETICKTYLEKGDEVVLCMPTYDHFRVYAESCDATLVRVYGPSAFEPKTEKILQAVTPRTKIIYIVNPNNPTGMMYSQEDIRTILTQAPHVLLIVDEAYFEFSGETVASLALEYPHLLVTRSFSKAFGLAGLRCGYVLTSPENLSSINKVRVGKNINSLAQVAASAALDDLDYMERYVNEVKIAKDWLAQKMSSYGLSVVKTPANFILVTVSRPKDVVSFLQEQNVFVRDRSNVHQLDGMVRITIGHPLLMERFWKIFEKIPQEFLLTSQPLVQSGC